ncbi:MAG: efflux RND transporter periplasmic adaptor subunit [Candidatus Marinimicrobia bacterium]|nr:efflux RND transporter periplasmic adaptor subunit [Candidatus Neomarinimicrobiota bacterium]MCF7827649.1 efflux RND transporter periplasmic adaptor subunit [Candidatus Neomarinimicrobiota bacterium]MCF7881296.1 efflux RND transporter periplasmic adaptor subunit [Candidatus Neomarinimicrobiota bacterium]
MRLTYIKKVIPILAGIAILGGLLSLSTCSSEDAAQKTEQTAEEQTLYTCSMHPNVVQDQPGDCPICGMDLVPMKNTQQAAAPENHEEREHQTSQQGSQEEAGQLWTCSMHPNVVQDEPGECPICGMDLVPMKRSGGSGNATASKVEGKGEIMYYQAPMDPSYISDKPGKSPMGMDLVPVYENQVGNLGNTITIDPTVVQNMGVRTAPVRKRNLTREIRAVGNVVYDETNLAHVHTKVTGYIEETHVQITGERVKKGEPLVEIYSPELVATQEEYLQAYRSAQRSGGASGDLLSSARRRLEFWDISEEQINRLEQTGEVRKTMTLYSPFSGVVVFTNAIDGMRVQPGMRMYEIADLSTVWVEAELYEYELPWLEENQQVEMNLSYTPGKTYEGRVDYIYPYLEEKTRTVKVRSVFPNPNGELKPGMYANLRVHSEIGKNVPAIPEESVIWSGERTLVFIALGDGHFAPRDVKLGALSGDGYYEVLSGARAGETVVTSGQFLLDSESKLKEALQKMLSKRESGSSESAPADTTMEMDSGEEMEMSEDQSGHEGMN